MKKLCILPLLLIAMMSACSAPSENSNAGNGNAAQPASSQNGAAPTSPAANPTASVPVQTTPSAQPATSPDGSNTPNQKTAAEKVADQAAAQASPQDASNAGPKLVVPVKRLDFGKQPKDKSLSRTFVIKNAGKAELKISAVEPS
jgi:hypothetical protein